MTTESRFCKWRIQGKVRNTQTPRPQEEVLDSAPELKLWDASSRVAVAQQYEYMDQKGKTKCAYGPYAIFRDFDTFYRYYCRIPTNRHTYNALLDNEWGPVRLYIDIDAKHPPKNGTTEVDYAACICCLLEEFFLKTYPDQPPLKLYALSGCRPDKLSFHIHSANHYWKNMCHLKAFMIEFREYLQKKPEQISQWVAINLDLAPYHEKQCFRLPFESKPGKTPLRPLFIYHEEGKKQALKDPNIQPPQQWLQVGLPHYHIPNEGRFGPFEMKEVDEKKNKAQKRKHTSICRPGDKEEEDGDEEVTNYRETATNLVQLLSKVCKWNFSVPPNECFSDVGRRSNDLNSFLLKFTDLVDTVRCLHSDQKHPDDDGGKSALFVSIDPLSPILLTVRTTCVRGTCKLHQNAGKTATFRLKNTTEIEAVFWSGKGKKKRVTLSLEARKTLLDIIESFFPHSSEPHYVHIPPPVSLFDINTLPLNCKLQSINERFIPEIKISPESHTFAVKSECGSGKSDAMSKTITKLLNQLSESDRLNCRVLVISCRRSLSHTITAKLNEMKTNHPEEKFVCYLDKEEHPNWKNSNRLVVSIDSCIHLMEQNEKGESFVRAPFILWVDEVSAAEKYFIHSPYLTGKRMHIWRIMEQLHKSAKYVLWTDAELTNSDLNVLNDWRSSPTLLHNTAKTATGERYILIPSISFGKQSLLKHLHEGKKVYIACDEKAEAKALHKLIQTKFEQLKVRYYDSNESGLRQTAEEWRDCKTKWLQYDVIITTSCIDYGVDFSPKEAHFDFVFGFFKQTSVDHQSAFQMLQRVRQLKHGGLRYVVTSTHFRSQDSKLLQYREFEDELARGMAALKSKMQKQEEKEEKLKDIELNMMIPQAFTTEGKSVVQRKDPFFLMYAAVRYIEYLAKHSFTECLTARICETGATLMIIPAANLLQTVCTEDDQEALKQIQTDAKKVKESMKEKEVQDLFQAKAMSTTEFNEWSLQKPSLTTEQQMALNKTMIMRRYGIEDETKLTVEFLERYGNDKATTKFKSFVRFSYTSEALLNVMRREQKHPAQSAHEDNQFEIIMKLADLLQIDIGKEIHDISNIQKLDTKQHEYIDTIDTKLKVYFPKVQRWANRDNQTYLGAVRMWIALCHSIFPDIAKLTSVSRKRRKVQQTDSSRIERESLYKLSWPLLHELLGFIHSMRSKMTNPYPLKQWALIPQNNTESKPGIQH